MLAPNGYRIIITKPYAVYAYQYGFKKHRKKRNTVRYRQIVRYEEIIKDGECFTNNIDRIIYVNAATYRQFMMNVTMR